MLSIMKKTEGTKLIYVLTGRLDTTTSPELENDIKTSIDGVTDLEFDFTDLEYISSAGLRVLLYTQKIMVKQGSMVVKNCKPEIIEIFEVTGFAEILTIE